MWRFFYHNPLLLHHKKAVMAGFLFWLPGMDCDHSLNAYLLRNVQTYVDWFKWDDAKHPLSNAPEPKRRFIPSKWEAKKVTIFFIYLLYIM
jgi:hypothetical protein